MASPRDLKRRIRWSYQHQLGPGILPESRGEARTIKGLVAPHAGYMYSGPVAPHSYLELARDGFPETFIILSPNHTGYGSLVSTMTTGAWETPLGVVEIDTELAQELNQNIIIDDDPTAHFKEHSIEVQLPFLQYLEENFQIVPLTMMMQDLETREVGEAIHQAIKTTGRDVVVLASTDLTHYKPQEVAAQEDQQVLQAVEKLDEAAMLEVVEKYNVIAVTVDGLHVRPLDELPEIVAREEVAIGVIATPATAAQDVADRMVAAGIRSILNFAPAVVTVPPGVTVRKVDLATELQVLAYYEQRSAALRDVRGPASG